MRKDATQFSEKEKRFARELGKYENKWVAISKEGRTERIVGSGDRITDAKREATKKGVKDPVFRKVPSSHKILIA